jgi:hypothetical protein
MGRRFLAICFSSFAMLAQYITDLPIPLRGRLANGVAKGIGQGLSAMA